MARLLADEQIPQQVSNRLRRLGHDVETVRGIDESKSGDGKPDEVVFAYAKTHRRAIVTFNERDFQRLHLADGDLYGILVGEVETYFNQQAKRLDDVIRAEESLRGKWIKVAPPRQHEARRRRDRRRRRS